MNTSDRLREFASQFTGETHDLLNTAANKLDGNDRLDAVSQARREVNAERFRARVETEKARLRAHVPWWHKIFPWKIVRR